MRLCVCVCVCVWVGVCVCVCVCVCVFGVGGLQLDDVEVTQCEARTHTLKLANTHKHTHTHTHRHARRGTHTHIIPTYVPREPPVFIKSSCEPSRIKGSMWSRAAVLRRRSGPDGFQSVRQTCFASTLFYPALLRYILH